MEGVLDKALALRGVTGVLVLARSWLTISSRGALTASDAAEVERLLSWTAEGSTGSIPWGEGGRCLHFHRAPTHTLILLKQRSAPSTPQALRMRLGISSTSDRFTRTGAASLFAPSCSLESLKKVHRPSSWY
ncbi:hypothetical protein DFH11DRAFT_1690086 [Phellopilus nigrolimitatus]|nr:hypothetical protein DFH11DRAFT_1690086 [Phellopilus nigrolimitatus]